MIFFAMNLSFSAHSDTQFSTSFESVAPVNLGLTNNAQFENHYEVGLAIGWMPPAYASLIGFTASQLGGNDAYKDVVEASFQNNILFRTHFQYYFSTPLSGWSIGTSYAFVSTSGVGAIDTVLEAATGLDFSNLKTLLTTANRSTEVDLSGNLSLIELWGAYSWELSPALALQVGVGVGKTLAANINIETGLPNFNNSSNGSALLTSAETALSDIIVDYGFSPILSTKLVYTW